MLFGNIFLLHPSASIKLNGQVKIYSFRYLSILEKQCFEPQSLEMCFQRIGCIRRSQHSKHGCWVLIGKVVLTWRWCDMQRWQWRVWCWGSSVSKTGGETKGVLTFTVCCGLHLRMLSWRLWILRVPLEPSGNGVGPTEGGFSTAAGSVFSAPGLLLIPQLQVQPALLTWGSLDSWHCQIYPVAWAFIPFWELFCTLSNSLAVDTGRENSHVRRSSPAGCCAILSAAHLSVLVCQWPGWPVTHQWPTVPRIHPSQWIPGDSSCVIERRVCFLIYDNPPQSCELTSHFNVLTFRKVGWKL